MNMVKEKIYAALSCDIVESTSLSEYGMFELQDRVEECFHDMRFFGYDYWGRLIRGDSIECLFENPNQVLRFALALKCYMKYNLHILGASGKSAKYGIRSSIGIGSMRIVNEPRGIMDGEAIYCAGRNLSGMAVSQFAELECRTVNPDVSKMLSMNYILVDEWINELSSKQAIVVYHKLMGLTENSIAKLYGLSQPAVNLRSVSAKWNMIEDAVERWEKFKF